MDSSPDGAATASAVSAPASAAKRADELSQWSHAQLVARVLALEAQLQQTATMTSSSSSSSSTPASRSNVAGHKHAHSPSALDGEEPAPKQSRRARKQEQRAGQVREAEAGARAAHAASSSAGESAAAAAPSAANSDVIPAALDASASSASPNASVGAPPASSAMGGAHPRGPGKSAGKDKGGFDWSNVTRRQIALKIMYLGTEYAGFAIQPQLLTQPTVEGELVRALLLTKLAPERDAARLTRCGRTDRGVHACGQVVAVQVRSRLTRSDQLGALPRGHEWREQLAAWHRKKAEFMNELQPAAGDTSLFDQQGYLAPAALKDTMCLRCGVPGVGYATDDSCETHEQELDYCRMLNGVLPASIRVVSWQPVPPEFNARFSCSARTYRYFFHADQLQLSRMQEAASQLVGSHDFRNFCKIDPTMSSHFTRCLTNIEVRACEQVPEDCVQITSPWPCNLGMWAEDTRNSMGGAAVDELAQGKAAAASSSSSSSAAAAATPAPSSLLHPDTLCEMLIHGNAFLYHQVRCMAAVLFLIGRGVEEPSLISQMLDVGRTPNKPQYDMAPESPLVLYDTCFPALPLTPGFDYTTKPASKPGDRESFVGLAAAQQIQMDQREKEAQAAASTSAGDPMSDIAQPQPPQSDDGSSHSSASAAAAASSSVAVSSPASASAAAPSASVASSSSSSAAAASPSAAPVVLNLYPSAAACLRNEELLFAHFHAQWRALSMQGKVVELFVNQCARNLQAVRNETVKLDMVRLQREQTSGKHVKDSQRLRTPQQPAYAPPPVVRAFAPLLPATVGCRGHGLRVMPYVAHGPHMPLLRRPFESSFESKVAGLKGKKLARHESVKDMSDKFKKDNSTFVPRLAKIEQ